MLRRSLPRAVMGKLHRLCQQPKTRSNRLIRPSSIEATIHAARPELSSVFISGNPASATLAAIAVSEPVALTAPALPVPTASAKQEHNHDDNQNRF